VSVADPTRSGSAQVTITPPVAVSVTPSTASVQTGGTQSFTATVTNTTNTAVTWQVSGITGGHTSVGPTSSAFLFTAPATVPSPPSFPTPRASDVVAARAPSPSVSAPAVAPPAVAVSVTPTTASVQTGGTQSFTATVTNTTNTAVTWQV